MKDYSDISDIDLMKLIKRGRKEAFVEIVRRHQRPLLNFFHGMGVYTDAEDMAQETFVRLFKYRKRYKPTAKFTTFLYLLARQARIDMLRKKMRRDNLEDKLTEEQQLMEQQAKSGSKDTLDVEGALEILPEAMRSVVVLNVYQGMKYQEIADVLEIPIGTVKSRMFEALNRLREVFNVTR